MSWSGGLSSEGLPEEKEGKNDQELGSGFHVRAILTFSQNRLPSLLAGFSLPLPKMPNSSRVLFSAHETILYRVLESILTIY